MGGRTSTPVAAPSPLPFTHAPSTAATPASAPTSPTPAPPNPSSSPTHDIQPRSETGGDTPTPTVHPETGRATPAVAVAVAAKRWYNWSKPEHRERERSKASWYMNPSASGAETPLATTPAATPVPATTAEVPKMEHREPTMGTPTLEPSKSDLNGLPPEQSLSVTPSFQLRSTTTLMPPRDDGEPSFRREVTNSDVSNFKYYHPGQRSDQPAGIHTRATMYRMDTRLKQAPLLIQAVPTTTSTMTTPGEKPAEKPLAVPTFVSRGLQTDLEVQPTNASSSQMHYYEKEQSQVVPLSILSNYSTSNQGFYHLAPQRPAYEPNLSPIGPPPTVVENPSARPPRASILKKPERSNPLAEQTHDQVLDELRKRNKNLKDGSYRVKKVHLLEKSDPPRTVTFDLPPTKASQSIMRSQKLFAR